MGRLRDLSRHTLLAHLWRRAKYHYFQRYILPQRTEVTIEGVSLDIRDLSLRMKEVLLSAKYELPETTMCRQLLEPGDRVLELGGAIGYVGLFCLINLKVAEVVSAEPNPRTASILRRNYHLNGLQPHLEEVAIGAREEAITFHVSTEFWTDNLLSAAQAESSHTITVPALPLKTLIRRTGRSFSALIIDIEGGEKCIDWEDIPPSISKIIIELHPSLIGYTHTYDVLRAIMNLGFQVESRLEEVIALRRIAHTS